MSIHEDGVDLVQYFEGCSNVAYACPSHNSNGGTWDYLTIGYGHSGPDVREGMRITTAQARDLLAQDMGHVEAAVRELVHWPMNETQRAAVCCLAFNLKPGLFKRSKTLVLLNQGRFGKFNIDDAMSDPIGPGLTEMAYEWAEFRGVTQKGGPNKHLLGLIRRRAAELELFFTGNWSVPRDLRQPQLLLDPVEAREGRALRPGMRSGDIADLHAALSAAGFPVVCDDAYTWATADAVRAFQQKQGLEVDGIYGMKTAQRLAEVLGQRL